MFAPVIFEVGTLIIYSAAKGQSKETLLGVIRPILDPRSPRWFHLVLAAGIILVWPRSCSLMLYSCGLFLAYAPTSISVGSWTRGIVIAIIFIITVMNLNIRRAVVGER
jgi:hypothetical protein